MLRLTKCGCGVPSLVRVHRAFWMRLFPGWRLYRCERCKTEQFLRGNQACVAAGTQVPDVRLCLPPAIVPADVPQAGKGTVHEGEVSLGALLQQELIKAAAGAPPRLVAKAADPGEWRLARRSTERMRTRRTGVPHADAKPAATVPMAATATNLGDVLEIRISFAAGREAR